MLRASASFPNATWMPSCESFMGAQARAIGRFACDIEFRATAGDGIFLVFKTPLLAAECGIAMQQEAVEFDRRRFGIETDLQLRIAIHYGPVRPVHDPILDAPSFAGREIIRAARMEPITPPGEYSSPNSWRAPFFSRVRPTTGAIMSAYCLRPRALAVFACTRSRPASDGPALTASLSASASAPNPTSQSECPSGLEAGRRCRSGHGTRQFPAPPRAVFRPGSGHHLRRNWRDPWIR